MPKIYVRTQPRTGLKVRHRCGQGFSDVWKEIEVDDATRAALEEDPYLEVTETPTVLVEVALATQTAAATMDPVVAAIINAADEAPSEVVLDNTPSANADGASAQEDSAELATVDSSGDAPEVVDAVIEPVVDTLDPVATPADNNADVKAAILQLDKNNEALWLKDGRPSTKAIEDIIGVTVSSGQRDLAWADLRTEGAE